MPTSLALAVAISAGVAAGVFLDSSLLSTARSLLAIAGLAAFLTAARGWRTIAWPLSCVALSAACLLLAADAEQRAMRPPLRQLLDERLGGFDIAVIDTERHDTPVVIEGRLIADAVVSENGATVRVDVDRAWLGPCPEFAAGGVSLSVAGTLAAESVGAWRAGRVIRAPAVLRRPARYLNHGVPDHERLLARRGIALVGNVKSAALVEVLSEGDWVDETASAIRWRVRQAIARHVGTIDRQSAAVSIAILIGDRGSLDPDVERRLQEAGTYHVIAISGGNIAILAGLVLAALWLIGVRGGWAAAGAVCLLSCYAYIAGGGPSVIRATVMAAIYLLLRVIDQRTAPSHAMSLTIAVVLLANPLSIADVGLWLTFGATAAIVAGASRAPLPSTPWLRAPAALLLASLAAEVLLLPISAFVFQRITVAGLAINLAAVPCMAIVQIAATLTAAADWLHLEAIAGVAGWITHFAVRGLVDSASLVDWVPWVTWRVPSPAMVVMAMYYVAVIGWFMARQAKLSRMLATVAVVTLLWMAIAPATLARRFGDGRLHLTMIDVGQGDAMLITLPNGRTLMVDTGGVSLGGAFDIGDRVLGPALRHRGLGRIDYLAVTHGDPDHLGGALSLVRDFDPLEVWYGTYVNNHEPSMRLQAAAARHRAGWRWLVAGDRIEAGGVEMRVHHPKPADWERQRVRNDDSLVIELRYGRVSMLLTGDIGIDVERELLPTLDLLPIVVLKAPHHGSSTSSSEEFIQALKPRLVLISCGRANPYGHPTAAVMARYDAAGAAVLRTDLNGQIEVTTDGVSLSAITFTGAIAKTRK